jgi:hypothetical protein
MLGTAFSMAVLTTTGFVMLFNKLPRNVRRIITKYALVTDFLAMVLTYFMFGGTVTALIAGAMVDIFISVLLYIANNPAEFAWLHDLIRSVKELVIEVKQKLLDMSAEYRMKKGDISVEPAVASN